MFFLCLFDLVMTLILIYKKRFCGEPYPCKATRHAASESSHGTSCSWVGSEDCSCCNLCDWKYRTCSFWFCCLFILFSLFNQQMRANALHCLGELVLALNKLAILDILQALQCCTAIDHSTPTLVHIGSGKFYL
ncbi:unnamed protein product [Musa textilis]